MLEIAKREAMETSSRGMFIFLFGWWMSGAGELAMTSGSGQEASWAVPMDVHVSNPLWKSFTGYAPGGR